MKIYDEIREEIEKEGWIKIGYTEEGKLIQRNINTDEIRILSEWIEIIKSDRLIIKQSMKGKEDEGYTRENYNSEYDIR